MSRAFTLIEVLVSITIILILASLLFPVFKQARSQAKGTVCVSNLHQIGLALKLYQADYGSYPPNSVVSPGFKPYYPVVLRCPFSKQQYPEYDYEMAASGDQMFEPGSPRIANWETCKEARGQMLPLAFDRNHFDPYLPADHKVLVFRENGSVNRVPGDPPEQPCIGGLKQYNY